MLLAIEKQNFQTEMVVAAVMTAQTAFTAKPAQIAIAYPSYDSEASSSTSWVTFMAGTFAFEQAIEMAFGQHCFRIEMKLATIAITSALALIG